MRKFLTLGCMACLLPFLVIAQYTQITQHNDNIGIGVATPVNKLEVNGNGLFQGALTSGISHPDLGGRLLLENPAKTVAGTAKTWAIYNMSGGYGNSLQFWAYDQASCAGGLCANRFTLMDNGNVGIGTATPDAKLAVNGNILAHKIRVSLNPVWPDYVFEKTYQLPTLQEVEKHIQQFKHLPEVPSAQEVSDNGIDLGASQAVLLKKIEELTLYLIEQNKKINALEKEVRQLKKK